MAETTISIADWSDYVADCAADGSGFQRVFREQVESDLQRLDRPKLLDIGCGGSIPSPLRGLESYVGQWDGVEPSEDVRTHPSLNQRWESLFELADIPSNSYPISLAYNVVEHVSDPSAFMKKLSEVMAPGGIFWGLTPHSLHPFARISRWTELAGFKAYAARRCEAREGRSVVNDYPAYYRLNSVRAVSKQLRPLGFTQATFYFYPSPQWSMYFPRPLRFFPLLYDRFLGNRVRGCSLLMAMRLVK